MAIVAGEILWKLSTTAGAAGNSTAQGDPNQSLGKYISTTALTDNTLHNLFDVVTGDENAASDVEYRCMFIHNSNGTLTYTAPFLWISAEVANGAAAAIAVDGVAASPIGQAGAQADQVANENTAPSGEAFSAPTSKGTGLALSDIPSANCKAIWIRRTAANNAALNNDGVTLSVSGDTAA